MQNTVFYPNNHNQMLFCAYYPIYAYVNPFLYGQSLELSTFNSNSGTTEKKEEKNTNQNIEVGEVTQSLKPRKSYSTTNQKKPKRRNHRNKSKLIESAKKNCQSNIINHILTYLTKHKQSENVLERGIKRLKKPESSKEKIKQMFYNCLTLVNLKRERKYINRKTILCFFSAESLSNQLPLLEEKLLQQSLLNIEDLCYLYRICIVYYLRNLSPMAILTSKRIESLAKKIHLKRRAVILTQFLHQDGNQFTSSFEE